MDSSALPVPLAPFVGRDVETAAIRAGLHRDGVRLLTLVGPGGVGKTRLALQVANEVRSEYKDGVVFIALAAVRDPNLVISAIAESLGVRDKGRRPLIDDVKRHLRNRQILLILDNFEQVLQAAMVVSDLLATASALQVIVTCRSVLRIYGEYDILIPPLSLPSINPRVPFGEAIQSEAVRLFVERARAANSDFRLTEANAPTIVSICRRLDGLPLAIELAAARITLLTPSAMLARMDRRLPLLKGGPRDQPNRLRTMGNAIAWSYDLLTEGEQALFRHLCVFVGGFTPEAAAAIGEEVGIHHGKVEHASEREQYILFDQIASLVDQSLLVQSEQPNGKVRYKMFETVREFGLEQLSADEVVAARRAHATWCIDQAERYWECLVTLSFYEWMDRIDADFDNVRAGLAWLNQTSDVTGVLRIAGSLGEYWLFKNHRQEGREWLEPALGIARGAAVPSTIRARGLRSAGWLAVNRGEHDLALEMGIECLSIWRRLGDRQCIALAYHLLGYTAMARGDYDQSVAYISEAEALFAELGNSWWVAGVRSDVLGKAVHGQGNPASATTILESSLAIYRHLWDPLNTAQTLNCLGFVNSERGMHAVAAEHYATALPLWSQLGIPEMQSDWLAGVANLAARHGTLKRSARLFGAAEALREVLGHVYNLPERLAFERATESARAALGDADFSAAWIAGQEQSLDESFDEASELLALIRALQTATEPRGSAYNSTLTHRERDVLRLLVAGRSDREIASALFIGTRTVQSHTEKIFAKLGARNRHEATAIAVRRGLD